MPGVKPPPDDKRIALYLAGYSIEQVAVMTNYSPGGVHYWLRKNGVKLRPPGRPSKHRVVY